MWEVRLVKQTVDGRDTSAQLAALLEHMNQEMASLPPEQRERMEALMKQSGVQGSHGGFRVCISPEMAQRDAPVLDREGHCQPASIKQHGSSTDFEFSCAVNGVTMNGKGQAVTLGNVIKTHTEVSTHTASGATHETRNDSEMTYLGSDCGGIKPPAAPPRP